MRDAIDLALLTCQRQAYVLKIRRADLHDDALWIVQNKTGAKRAIEITGEFAALIEQINARPRERLSAMLIQDDCGRPLGEFGLRSRFAKVRKRVGVDFQFRDLRAKAATDTGDLAHSKKLLGHRNREMTEHYVRARVGERVQPLRSPVRRHQREICRSLSIRPLSGASSAFVEVEPDCRKAPDSELRGASV